MNNLKFWEHNEIQTFSISPNNLELHARGSRCKIVVTGQSPIDGEYMKPLSGWMSITQGKNIIKLYSEKWVKNQSNKIYNSNVG
jgi:hypothetical protein